MRFTVTKTRLRHTPRYFLKKAGYKNIYDKKSGKDSFVKQIHGVPYPRFHVYVEEKNEDILFNIHLDQRKPIYNGSPAHGAEYENPAVEQEIQRIKTLI